MRFIFPILLVIISLASFMLYTNPTYQSIKALQVQAAQYDTALANATELQTERDALGAKYRSISPDDLARLQKLLPDNADNIRLIIDIQRMAQSYGMSLDTIKFDAPDDSSDAAASSTAPAADGTTPAFNAEDASTIAAGSQDYGTFNLEFSTTATYANFLSFLKDVESSLRLTDIQSVDFTTNVDPTKDTNTYTVKLSTYWLKG